MRQVVVTPPVGHYITDWHFSPAIHTGEFVFCSGVTGTRDDDSIADDPTSQFRDAFQNLQATVRHAGLQLSDVVELTTYHVNLKQHWKTFTEVKDEFLVAPHPSSTAIGVSDLLTERALVEIRAIAHRESDTRASAATCRPP